MVGPGDLPRGQFTFDAGRLCLDFVNTVQLRPFSHRLELINTYDDLLAWARQATIITPGEATALAAVARKRGRSALDALAQVRTLRESAYAIFSCWAAGLPAQEADLRTLNRAVGQAMAHAGLIQTGSRFEWGWPDTVPELNRVSWWVVRSSAELLTSQDLTFVRECAGYDCGRLFMDMTKNRSRRWCDMRTCGNRAKSRRHHERRRAADRSRRLAG